MKVAELAQVAQTSMKVMSAYNGKVLCQRFDPKKHKAIGEREVASVWADLVILKDVFGNQAKPIICVYADGTEECYMENPF